jgi:hypothetical protein
LKAGSLVRIRISNLSGLRPDDDYFAWTPNGNMHEDHETLEKLSVIRVPSKSIGIVIFGRRLPTARLVYTLMNSSIAVFNEVELIDLSLDNK